MNSYRIAVDAMGGDNAPGAVVEGCLEAVKAYPDTEILLFGQRERLEPLAGDARNVRIVDAREVIDMHASPMLAVRKMADSSLVRAMLSVREGQAQAAISAGSTGAVLAAGMLRVGRIPGIERPALAPVLPGRDKPILLIDCGANVDCQPKYLEQFGLMGSVYMRSVIGAEDPKVGLINIGTENEKGDRLTREAFQLMSCQKSYRFGGNLEARDVLMSDFDVAVADGFVGNVVLKNTEGTVSLLLGMIKQQVGLSFKSKLGALLMRDAFGGIKSKMDYQAYGGAPLLGVNGAVIKAHGSSKPSAICAAVRQARDMVRGEVVEKIRTGLSGLTD